MLKFVVIFVQLTAAAGSQTDREGARGKQALTGRACPTASRGRLSVVVLLGEKSDSLNPGEIVVGAQSHHRAKSLV